MLTSINWNEIIFLLDKVPARVVLYMLSFSGFLVSFMMRTDINLAMVAMVKTPRVALNSSNATESSKIYCSAAPSNTSYTDVVQDSMVRNICIDLTIDSTCQFILNIQTPNFQPKMALSFPNNDGFTRSLVPFDENLEVNYTFQQSLFTFIVPYSPISF